MIAADVLSLGTPIGLDLVNNPVVVNVDPYELGTITERNTIRYELDVRVFNGEEYLLAATLETYEEPAKVTGNATSYRGAFFEIGGILKGFLEAEMPFFGKADTKYLKGIFEVPDMTLQYYTEVRIYVDDMLEDTVTNSVRYAYKGAISETDWERHGRSFFTKWLGNGRFVSAAPAPTQQGGETTGPGQVGWLSWIHNYAETILSINLKVIGLYENGTEVIKYPLEQMVVSPMGVYAVPVGGASVVSPLTPNGGTIRTGVELPNNEAPLELLKLDAEGLVSYRAWLVDENGDRVSEVITIAYDQTYHRNLQQLVYVNSLGVPTAVIATGQNAIGMEYARTEGESYRGFGYEANLTERRVDIVEGMRKYVLRLQYGKLSQMRHLLDVGYAKEIWLLDNKQWLPLVNVGKVMPIHDDAEEWAGIVMEMEMGYKETAHSYLPVPEATDERPTAWRPLTTVCDTDSRGRYYGMLKVLTIEKYYTDNDEPVRPALVMKNKPGANFFPLTPSAACVVGNTPYLQDVARSREGSFYNQTCGAGLIGGKATLNIPIGSWGSLLNMQDTYDKADAEMDVLDTQAYANANGPCNSVGVYDPGVIDAGFWWIRVGDFSGDSEPSGFVATDNGNPVRPGNMWFQVPANQPNQTHVYYGTDRFNRQYPVLSAGRLYVFLPYYKQGKTLRFFRNGLLVASVAITGPFPGINFPAEPASGEKWYVDAV